MGRYINWLWNAVGAFCTIVGLTGVAGDLVGWSELLNAAEPYADTAWSRLLLVGIGMVILIWRANRQLSPNGFVSLDDASDLIVRMTFKAERFSPRHRIITEFARSSGQLREEFYIHAIVESHNLGNLVLYKRRSGDAKWVPYAYKIPQPLPESSTSKYSFGRYDFYKYIIKIQLDIVVDRAKKVLESAAIRFGRRK